MAENSSTQTFVKSDYIIIGGSILGIILAFLTRYYFGGPVVAFIFSALAVAMLASLVGLSVEQLGDRFGPGATGVLQSALGNLPELFICLFALREGLVVVVQSALIGSILANLLLIMGLCFVTGGLKHGVQQLDSQRAQSVSILMVLAVSAMLIPSLASYVHTPAAAHETELSLFTAIILLVIFALSLPASLKKGETNLSAHKEVHIAQPRWSLVLAISLLALSAGAAAFVSDWFVHAIEPAMDSLHISDAFAGLVIIAIAGNAIENVVGIQLALKNQSKYAFSVVINSPLQIALVLAPLLVILSQVFGFASLTLVFSPMLIIALVIAVLLSLFITIDGKSNWLEGAVLIAIYVIIAASFWWG